MSWPRSWLKALVLRGKWLSLHMSTVMPLDMYHGMSDIMTVFACLLACHLTCHWARCVSRVIFFIINLLFVKKCRRKKNSKFAWFIINNILIWRVISTSSKLTDICWLICIKQWVTLFNFKFTHSKIINFVWEVSVLRQKVFPFSIVVGCNKTEKF